MLNLAHKVHTYPHNPPPLSLLRQFSFHCIYISGISVYLDKYIYRTPDNTLWFGSAHDLLRAVSLPQHIYHVHDWLTAFMRDWEAKRDNHVCAVIKSHRHFIISGRQVAFLFPENTQGVRCGAECMFVYVLLFVDGYYGAFAAAIGSNTRMCVTNLCVASQTWNAVPLPDQK